MLRPVAAVGNAGAVHTPLTLALGYVPARRLAPVGPLSLDMVASKRALIEVIDVTVDSLCSWRIATFSADPYLFTPISRSLPCSFFLHDLWMTSATPLPGKIEDTLAVIVVIVDDDYNNDDDGSEHAPPCVHL